MSIIESYSQEFYLYFFHTKKSYTQTDYTYVPVIYRIRPLRNINSLLYIERNTLISCDSKKCTREGLPVESYGMPTF